MSKLMEKLRKEAAELQRKEEERKERGGDFVKIDWYAPEKGDNIIRVLANKNPEELPFNAVNIHYGVPIKGKDGKVYTKVPVRCRKDFDEECPACRASEFLADAGDKEAAKAVRPVERYLYNVLNYTAKKVQVYAAPSTVHKELVIWMNEVGESVFSPTEGRNFKLTKSVDPTKKAQFGVSYSVRVDLKESAIPSKLMPLLDTAVDLESIYTEDHSDDMNAFLKRIGCEDTVGSKKPKAKAKVEETEDEDDDDMPSFEDDEPAVKKPAAKKPVVEEEEDDLPDFSTKPSPKAAPKPAAKKPVVEEAEDEVEEADVDTGDDDELEAELRRMGVKKK